MATIFDEFDEQDADETLKGEGQSAILDEAIDKADFIVERLLEIVFTYDLLLENEPAEAVRIASELWDAARTIAAEVVSTELQDAGLPVRVGFVGQTL